MDGRFPGQPVHSNLTTKESVDPYHHLRLKILDEYRETIDAINFFVATETDLVSVIGTNELFEDEHYQRLELVRGPTKPATQCHILLKTNGLTPAALSLDMAYVVSYLPICAKAFPPTVLKDFYAFQISVRLPIFRQILK